MDTKSQKWVEGLLEKVYVNATKVLENPRLLSEIGKVEKNVIMRWQLHVEDKVVVSGKSIYDPGQVEFVMDPSSVNIALEPGVGIKNSEMQWKIFVKDKVTTSGSTNIDFYLPLGASVD